MSTIMRFTGLRLGADDFITKPVAIELLAKSLLARIQRAREMSNGHLELEKALRDLEFMKKALNEHAIVSMTDAQGRITYVNNKFVEVTRFTVDELVGNRYQFIDSGAHDQMFFKHLWKTISSGQLWQGTIHNKTKDGKDFDAYTTILPQFDDMGIPRRYISVMTDITRLNDLARNVQDDAERFSLAMQSTNSGMWEWNLEDNTVFYSDSWLSIMGYSHEDVTGLSWPELIHPEDFNFVFAKLMTMLKRDSDGQYNTRHRLLNNQGKWDWVSETARIIKRDDHGHGLRIVGMTHLINEQIKLEVEKEGMQAQLLQASKMESIGKLTAGIAHDFNNLLGGMLGYAELSSEVLEDSNVTPEKIRRYMGEIISAGTRAKELITQMLMFSRLSSAREETSDKPVSIELVIDEVLKMLVPVLPHAIELRLDVQDHGLMTMIQPVQLHQLLVNLCINAKEAMHDTGTITISLRKYTDEAVCNVCSETLHGPYAEIAVHDTGAGISEQVRANIFDPFFTTKDVGKGTGMGLSIVHGVIHALNGHILLDSTEGKGTSVRLLFPATETQESVDGKFVLAGSETRQDDIRLDDITVMLVDDEHAICSMLSELLRMRGATVIPFTSPDEALGSFVKDPYDIDLLITDQKMPSKLGFDMAREMRQLRHDLPVIICTGYSEKLTADIAASHGMSYIEKPINLGNLISLIFGLTEKRSVAITNA